MNRLHFMGSSPFRQRPRWGLLRAFPQGSMRTIATLMGGQERCAATHRCWGHMTPRFGGGRYRPPRFCCIGAGEAA